MPVYEFLCKDCDKRFEIVQPMSAYDPSSVVCPACGSRKVERRWTSLFTVTSKKS